MNACSLTFVTVPGMLTLVIPEQYLKARLPRLFRLVGKINGPIKALRWKADGPIARTLLGMAAERNFEQKENAPGSIEINPSERVAFVRFLH